MNLGKTLFASIALVASLGAQAQVTGSLGGGAGSFLTLSAPGLCGICTLTGAVNATIVGGSIVQDDQPFADIPKGVVPGGLFLSAGPMTGQTSTVTFTGGTDYISFLWGSPDLYNSLTVTTANAIVSTFTALDLGFEKTGGQQDFSQYVQFAAAAGDSIVSLSFSNVPSIDAFEAANFTVTAPVPEPETYVLMLAGLGAVGFMSRRRRRQA